MRPISATAVFIGDGHSGWHASLTADIVFARSHLKDLMNQRKRHFGDYVDFFEITAEFDIIVSREIFTRSKRIDMCRISSRHLRSIQRLWESPDVMQYVGYPNGLGWNQAEYEIHLLKLENSPDAIHLTLEDKHGNFVGEATLSFPDKDDCCHHDLKLRSDYWGKGFGSEAWETILDRSRARWPQAKMVVTPSVANTAAINMYRKFGFEFVGGAETWNPPPNDTNAVPVIYRKMIG